jgi:hypothetical protein
MAHHGSVPTSGSTAAIALGARRRRIVGAFEKHQATSPDSARTLAEMGLSESRTLQRLQDAGVVAATGGRFYLNRERWGEYRSVRRLRASLVLVLAALAAITFALMSRGQ